MTVAELIRCLEKMPMDAEVWHLWDGALRTEINYVWLARNGSVGTADFDHVCYETEERPEDAPTSQQDPYWNTPSSRTNEQAS